MTLTTAQKNTLKADILADPALSAQVAAQNWDSIAATYSAVIAAFIVWKNEVTIRQTGQVFNGPEWAGMTTANHTRLQSVAQYLMSYSPAIQGVRDMFNDIWSGAGGANTRAALLVLWKRSATRVEKLFAQGTGSDASPATLVVEGTVTAQNISDAMNGL